MFTIVFNELIKGFGISLQIFGLTLLGALPLGLLVSVLSMSRNKVIKSLTKIIIWIIRGTPLMLQLLIIYYGPGVILGNNIWGKGASGRFIATIVAFVINYSCYFAEIYRGGIESIPQGQYDAGAVLGMNKVQIFFKIVLLQVIKRILPSISNEVITLVKDTSLARIISVYELMWSGEAFIKSTGIIWPLFFTGVFYLACSGVLTILLNKLENRLSYFK